MSTVGPGLRAITFTETINSTVVTRFVPVLSNLWRTHMRFSPYSAARPFAPRSWGASFFMTRISVDGGFFLARMVLLMELVLDWVRVSDFALG
jgi:hypothetical protein